MRFVLGIPSMKVIAGGIVKGSQDGELEASRFANPTGICMDCHTNTVFVADSDITRIRTFHLK